MAVLNAVSIAEIKARGSIKDADVLKLRRNYYDDGSITADEADTIFALNDACPVQDPAWADCFVETITDYLVEQTDRGYLTTRRAVADRPHRPRRAGRQQDRAGAAGQRAGQGALGAEPQSLVRFALDQVNDAVLSGTGPLRSGRNLEPGVVSEADVDLLRRILYAAASDGNIAITQTEAEVLFELDELSAGGNNHPPDDLFVKAIANCMMATSGYTPPPREVALARDAWLDRRGELSLDNVLSGMATGLKGLFDGYREQTAEEVAIAQLTQQKVEIVAGEIVAGPAEAEWLAGQSAGRAGHPQRARPADVSQGGVSRRQLPGLANALRQGGGRGRSDRRSVARFPATRRERRSRAADDRI